MAAATFEVAAFAAFNVTLTAPPGAEALQDFLTWPLFGGCIACAIASMIGLEKMGIFHSQQSYSDEKHGKAMALFEIWGALGLGPTPTIADSHGSRRLARSCSGVVSRY